MNTIEQILKQAGDLPPRFHIHIDNPPWMPLDIEDLATSGPNGLPTISVAHYGDRAGKRMRDPEMLFEVRREGRQLTLEPYYWRSDYLKIEQYSSFRDDEQRLFTLARLQAILQKFAQIWDANLHAQGYVEAFEHQRKKPVRRFAGRNTTRATNRPVSVASRRTA